MCFFVVFLLLSVMSIGICNENDMDILRKLADKTEERNVILIAATANQGGITYPASFENVIGVKHNIRGLGNRILYIENSSIGVNVEVCSPREVVREDGSIEEIPFCNSYAAAKVTGLVITMMIEQKRQLSTEDVKKLLKGNAYFIYKESSLGNSMNKG